MLQKQRCLVLKTQISTSIRELVSYGHEAALITFRHAFISEQLQLPKLEHTSKNSEAA